MTTTRVKPRITLARLKQALDYDPAPGVFRWKIRGQGRKPPIGSVAGHTSAYGYWIIGIDGQAYKAHHLAWYYVYGAWPAGEMDHRDGVKHNNSIDNLRLATQSQNNANRPRYRNNKSGFKGAHFQNGKWRSHIRLNRRSMYIGSYDTPEEAHAAYVAKAKELFGEFANSGDT